MRYRVRLNHAILGSQVLEKEPIGLTDITPTLKRGENHGFTLETEVKLKFYCGAGKEFIDQAREEYGIDAEVEIFIDQICGGEAGLDAPDYSIDYSDDYGSRGRGTAEWEVFYEGLLSLKTWREEDSEDGLMTLCDINPAGIVNTVKNRLDTKVDLFALETMEGTPLEALDYVGYELNMHSKEILYKASLTIDTGIYLEGHTFLGTHDMFAEFPLEILDYDEIGVNEMEAPFVSIEGTGGSPQPIYENDSEEDVILNIEYSFIGTITEFSLLPRDYTMFIYYRVEGSFAGGKTAIASFPAQSLSGSSTYGQDVDISGILTLTIPTGQNLYIYTCFENYDSFSSPVPSVVGMNFTTCYINLSLPSTTADTIAKAVARFETGAQIARVITDQEDAFRSNYFGRTNSQPYAYADNGCGAFVAHTNGFMIRGFPTTGDNARTIRMSMNEFFKGSNAIDNLGMGIEKEGDDYFIVIEPKEYFYDASTTILTLDNVPNIKRYELPERYYSRVNVGYDKWETELRNGLDEVNSKRQYDTGIKAVSNELDLISSFVSSPYRIEVPRRKQYVDTFTEDSDFDEDNYIICLERSDSYATGELDGLNYAEKDENFAFTNNILSSQTTYNLRISPARNLLRWSNVINSGLTKYEGREIKFTSGEGNYKAETQIDGDCSGNWNNALLSEGQNIQWDDADNSDKNPLWLPEGAEFSFPITKAQHDAILANPKGVIEFSGTDTGHEKWFIDEYKNVPEGASVFKVIKAFV